MAFQAAQWIWLAHGVPQPQATVLIRRRFDMPAHGAVTLAIAANHIYRLYLNGVVIGRGPDRADPRFPFLDRYDLTPYVRPGRNVLVALVHHFRTELKFPGRDYNGRAWC